VNFIRRLALQEKKRGDSPLLDFVEIARVPDMLPRLFPSWSGLGLISTTVLFLHTNAMTKIFQIPISSLVA